MRENSFPLLHLDKLSFNKEERSCNFECLAAHFGLLCISHSGTDYEVTSWRKVLCVFMRHSDYAAVQSEVLKLSFRI